MSNLPPDLRQRAQAWADDDPDPETRAEVADLLARGDAEALEDRFGGMLEFGTAGLRGVLGAGPNRFNRAVVARATAGLCAYLLESVPDAAERGVCIGFDARRLSRETAREAAEIVAGAGLPVFLFSDLVPTPVLAYSVRERRAAAGVMVTASHNPPEYNGYKVYWGHGAQIVPPHDRGIAAAIARVDSVRALPRRALPETEAAGRLTWLGAETEAAYRAGVLGMLPHREVPREVRIAYTALHGVGERLVREIFREAGFGQFASVAEQAEPDGRFPTVHFPNPEEEGAMDLVLDLARRTGADVVIANDPDVDRLAVAVPGPDGAWRALTGNEVGALLGHYLLSEGASGPARLVVSTVVSSVMLGEIARVHGARWEQTLTGFKWICDRAMQLEREAGATFVFGFEEALGYVAGTLVRDKDGISAALLIAEMTAWCKARGRTLLEELEEAWRRYGLYVNDQVSERFPGAEAAATMARMMNELRTQPPERLGRHPVVAVQDFLQGTRTPRDGAPEPLSFPRSDVLCFELAGGHRVMMRPSGTEPKIKYYFDVRDAVGTDETPAQARVRALGVLAELVEQFQRQVRELVER